ncbi:MAG: phosphate-starvation-inducible PsiE family protein [Aquificaceae bacterium]|nr:phosphate-starvation-inducible PsiE family protein [Aquificaceae bacterium]
MKDIKELKEYYRWNARDEANLEKIRDMAIKHLDDFVKVIPNSDVDKGRVNLWLEDLFELRCSEALTKTEPNLPNLLRHFLQEKIEREVDSPQERYSLLTTLNKVVDFCLERIISRESLTDRPSYLGKYQRWMIRSIRRVSRVFDAFIFVTLLLVGLFIVTWIVYEFYMVLTGELPLERGGLSILGSVLILYAISELLAGQIRHMIGGAVSIKAFVSVALAAVIRKVLIISLSPEKFYELITLALVLLALGVVFLLIHRVESST